MALVRPYSELYKKMSKIAKSCKKSLFVAFSNAERARSCAWRHWSEYGSTLTTFNFSVRNGMTSYGHFSSFTHSWTCACFDCLCASIAHVNGEYNARKRILHFNGKLHKKIHSTVCIGHSLHSNTCNGCSFSRYMITSSSCGTSHQIV